MDDLTREVFEYMSNLLTSEYQKIPKPLFNVGTPQEQAINEMRYENEARSKAIFKVVCEILIRLKKM